MAPLEEQRTPKDPKAAQPSATKKATTVTKDIASPAKGIKNIIATKKTIVKIPLKMNKTVPAGRQRTTMVPKVNTPKPKEKKSVALSESAKKPIRKRRPLGAHSGVPVPDKMKLIIQNKLCSFDIFSPKPK